MYKVLLCLLLHTIIASLLLGTSARYCLCSFCLNVIMRIFVNLPIFHLQGWEIQNLAVVSCRLSVSVSKVLVIQDLTSFLIELVRRDPTPPLTGAVQVSIPRPLLLEFDALPTELPGASFFAYLWSLFFQNAVKQEPYLHRFLR